MTSHENPDEDSKVVCSNQTNGTNFPATGTPTFLVKDMLALARVNDSHHMLEPSAGYGNIAFVAREYACKVDCIELNQRCVEILSDNGFDVKRADFLSVTPEQRYDSVVMCPPRNSIPHVEHAIKFLKPGARLVALIREDSPGLDALLQSNPNSKFLVLSDMFEMNGQAVPSGLLVYEN